MKKSALLLSVLAVGFAYADGNVGTSAMPATGTSGTQQTQAITMQQDGNAHVGTYAEIQAGVANSSALSSGGNSAGAGRLDVGYTFNPYVGVEAGMTGVANPSAGSMQAPLQFYDVSVKGILPISSWFDLHIQGGLAYATMSAPTVNGTLSGAGSDATMKFLVGAGADFFLTDNFALVVNDYNYLGAEAGSTSGAGGNTNILMGGIKYNF